MFYLGFSDCASAELCLVVCFSLIFYYFHAKKHYAYRFFGGRPYFDSADTWGETPLFDDVISRETFFDDYGDIIEYSKLYEDWFYESDAIEEAVEHAENTIVRDNARKELRKFIDNEVTERWFIVYRKYYDPKYKWYS